MVDDINPLIIAIGIAESFANNYIADPELGLAGYVMFRKDKWEEGEEEYYYTSNIL